MPRRQPLPRLWLMTDERIADVMATAARLPGGAGIVFRHHATAPSARHALFGQIRTIARRRGLTLLLAGTAKQARAWRADGVHTSGGRDKAGLRSAPVHNPRELVAALRARADLIFVSPVFPTRSHPGARTLGIKGLRRLARAAPVPVIALGGMTEKRFRISGVYGWAAIDALS